MLFRGQWDHLLLAARGGDTRALGQLLDVANDDLRAAAAGVVRRATRARLPVEEVFADALVAVLREIGTLRATDYIGFRYWFASIARNHVRRLLRDERSRPDTRPQAEPEKDAEEPAELSPESQEFLRGALLQMPRSQQLAFVLREGLALSWHTIAFVLERREPAAARLVHYRAITHVKELAATRPTIRLVLPAIQS